jgi:hypothetical protein
VAATFGIGTSGGVLGGLLMPRIGLVLGGLAAVAAGWGLRFNPSPEAVAWRRGAAGQRRTARFLVLLERYGWVVLHDLAIPGSRANIDCDDPERGGRGAVGPKHRPAEAPSEWICRPVLRPPQAPTSRANVTS